MSRMEPAVVNPMQKELDTMCQDISRRLLASPTGLCPLEVVRGFLYICRAQTCGKCTACGIGLSELTDILDAILAGKAQPDIMEELEVKAELVKDTAYCALGKESAELVIRSLEAFRDDYIAHLQYQTCARDEMPPIPCQAQCPANVDVPGYLALIHAGRYNEAVQLIRKDNPMTVACAYICEHPCENRCRRNVVDAPVNIRALKRYAVDHADNIPTPAVAPSTGRTVAVIGGGPCGLTTAYFLAIMGHKVTIYEKRKRLGGMLRYGIPSYRLPRQELDKEIDHILSTGIEVVYEADVGGAISYTSLCQQYDVVFLAVGAHTDKKVGIPGEDAVGVTSAVDLLRGVGDEEIPDFTGKQVVVIGGGNVAMDCVRSAVRMGADRVSCVYRRRKEDMTAHILEVDGAIAEGVEMRILSSPVRIETDENNHCTALWVQPQITGPIGKDGRPKPLKAVAYPEVRIPADVIVVAVGQAVETAPLEAANIQLKRGTIVTASSGKVPGIPNMFAAGECVYGPKTAVRAVSYGKLAAANIDEFLGYHHRMIYDIDVPVPPGKPMAACGRIDPMEMEAFERKTCFTCIEYPMSDQEATQESSRCLRCDYYGMGIGNRKEHSW